MLRSVLLLALALCVIADEFNIENVLANECEESAKSKIGDQLEMHYDGYLTDGKKFDSSRDRGEPFSFQLGVGQVIKGWDEGLQSMCPGDKRKLTIPADMGYGDNGAGDVIPPGATLHFDVELIAVKEAPPQPNIFKAIDSDEDKMITKEEIMSYITNEIPTEQLAEGQTFEGIAEEIFQHEDKDRDGYISYEEFSGPKHDEL